MSVPGSVFYSTRVSGQGKDGMSLRKSSKVFWIPFCVGDKVHDCYQLRICKLLKIEESRTDRHASSCVHTSELYADGYIQSISAVTTVGNRFEDTSYTPRLARPCRHSQKHEVLCTSNICLSCIHLCLQAPFGGWKQPTCMAKKGQLPDVLTRFVKKNCLLQLQTVFSSQNYSKCNQIRCTTGACTENMQYDHAWPFISNIIIAPTQFRKYFQRKTCNDLIWNRDVICLLFENDTHPSRN